MANILRSFQVHFLELKSINFEHNSIDDCSYGLYKHHISIGSDKGLDLIMQQAQ